MGLKLTITGYDATAVAGRPYHVTAKLSADDREINMVCDSRRPTPWLSISGYTADGDFIGIVTRAYPTSCDTEGNMSWTLEGIVSSYIARITQFVVRAINWSYDSYEESVSGAEVVNVPCYSTTRCTTPTSASFNSTSSTGGNVTLSWAGAANGINNNVNGYDIQIADSANGSNWGSWSSYKSVSGAAPSGSVAVSPPGTLGYYRKARVRAKGTAGSSWYPSNPEWRESSNSVKRTTNKCTNPTSVSLSSPTSTGDSVTLSWSGAGAGDASLNYITGYIVQRCESSDGSNWGSWSNLADTTGTSISVSPPTTRWNYYKYRVKTKGSGGESYYADGYKESSNTLRAVPSKTGAPSGVSLDDTVLISGTTTLRWSAGTDGAYNPIMGYAVQRREWDGSSYDAWQGLATVDGLALTVSPPGTEGHKYAYRVCSSGEASGYGSDYVECPSELERASQACHAPTSLTISADQSSGDAVALNWSGASDGYNNAVTGYIVERALNSGSFEVLAAVVGSNTLSLSVTPPDEPGDVYSYRVRSSGQVADSPDYSPVVSLTKIVTLSAPVLRISPSMGISATARWTEAVLTGTTGEVLYTLQKDGESVLQTSDLLAVIDESGTYTVEASAAGLTSVSNSGTFTYDASLVGASDVKVTPAVGAQTTVTWTAGYTQDGSAVTYDVLFGDTAVASGLTVTSLALVEEQCVAYGAGVEVRVRTNGAGKSALSESVTYRYIEQPITTDHIGLIKPRRREYMLVGPLNQNSDILDEHIGAIELAILAFSMYIPPIDTAIIDDLIDELFIELTAAEAKELLTGLHFFDWGDD